MNRHDRRPTNRVATRKCCETRLICILQPSKASKLRRSSSATWVFSAPRIHQRFPSTKLAGTCIHWHVCGNVEATSSSSSFLESTLTWMVENSGDETSVYRVYQALILKQRLVSALLQGCLMLSLLFVWGWLKSRNICLAYRAWTTE